MIPTTIASINTQRYLLIIKYIQIFLQKKNVKQ
jgi:hypothetical protein